ncbi:MAG: mandelate racemase/muconate lactonizing enzyme family protein [Bacteroidota bacterium]|nr:mandelate racemase/muconate lactonizing enzyme family protein [Odoribacter sp.]MDP3644495.1 mandelate racemase/muconate lactonizing enzyme family protein [Bacteroidota bacterium]
MKTNRRKFIATAIASGLAASLPLSSYGKTSSVQNPDALKEKYAKLDEILKQPVFKKELFSSPVIIETLELLRYRNSFLCRVRSKDGAEGISVGHSGQLRSLYPIFTNLLQPFFLNKDARDLDLILEKVYVFSLNFRLSGMALGVPLATIEFAILDMMGRIAVKPIGQLIGDIHHPEVAVYQATEYREKPVAESMELIKRDVAEYNAKALKIKVGGLMFGTTDMNAVGPVGRTETIIPLFRKTFGDDMILYADSNGFYSVEEAIRVGKLLEEYHFQFFEEPVPFDWYEETKQVADALTIPVAGGEQEYSLHGFRWLIANDGLQIVQPDTFYFGGMIRAMKVAKMAQAFGKKCTPHMTGGDLGFLYMMHFVSALPNALPFHEFKGFKTDVIFECKTSPLKSVNGMVKVPTGPGLGVVIDPEFIKKHQIIKDFIFLR